MFISDSVTPSAIFYPPPDEGGGGGRVVLASPRMSVHPSVSQTSAFYFPEQNSSMDVSIFLHTHPLGGVDVPSGVFEILPS